MNEDQAYREVASRMPSGIVAYLLRKGQLVIARSRPCRPYDGNSFWITYRDGHWHVVTWAPRVYRAPEAVNVVQLCVELMDSCQEAMSEVPEPIVRSHGLTCVPLGDWDKRTES
jgi:hypothetical protein